MKPFEKSAVFSVFYIAMVGLLLAVPFLNIIFAAASTLLAGFGVYAIAKGLELSCRLLSYGGLIMLINLLSAWALCVGMLPVLIGATAAIILFAFLAAIPQK